MTGLFYLETTTILWKRKNQPEYRCSIILKKAHHECWYSKQACPLRIEINNYGPVFRHFSVFHVPYLRRILSILTIFVNQSIHQNAFWTVFYIYLLKRKNILLKAFLDCISVALCLTTLDRCTVRPLTSAPRNRKWRSNFRRYLKTCLLLQRAVHT